MNEAERFLREQMNRQAEPQSKTTATPPPPPPQGYPNPTWAQTSAYAAPTPSGPQQMVSMGEAFKRFWTLWTFQGRASRSEYWWARLAMMLLSFAVNFLLTFLFALAAGEDGVLLASLLNWVWQLVALGPDICLAVRRLHDTGHSGWHILIVFIPLIGWIPFLVWMLRASEPRENQYGPVPNCSREQ